MPFLFLKYHPLLLPSPQKALRKEYSLQERYKNESFFCNAQLSNPAIQKYCTMSNDATRLLNSAMESLHLSMRAYNRILKVSRTIADLQGDDLISTPHVAEAVQYRELDQKYWS